jgi:nucleoside-diphosphate-sugar epimerase
LDDSEALTAAAREHDIIIHTASGFHTDAAKALVIGLGKRKAETGRDVHYFHTTGTSNLGDKPISGEYRVNSVFSDKDEDLYSYLVEREAQEAYPQRTTDLAVIHTGLEHQVKTYLIMSPTIYGLGSGLFNRKSIQIPLLIRTAIKKGQVDVITPGLGSWDAVHIEDLTKLYELLLTKVLNGEDVPSGKRGIFFSETGDYTWLELATGLAQELYSQGVLKTPQVNHISLDEAAEQWGGNAQFIELGFASNARTKAELSRELGWKPTRTKEDFVKNFREEVEVVVAEQVETSPRPWSLAV